MPVVIDEIVVQLDVCNAEGGGADRPAKPALAADDRQALIAECVERVLEVLRRQQEP